MAFEFLAQFVAVISHVAEQMLWRVYPADQTLGERKVVRLTPSQHNCDQASFSICGAAQIFVLRPPRERPIACF